MTQEMQTAPETKSAEATEAFGEFMQAFDAFKEANDERLSKRGADVVLDMVGGDYFPKNLDALKTGGRIVYIATQAGGEVALPIFKLMLKRALVTGSTLRPRNADEKARLAAAHLPAAARRQARQRHRHERGLPARLRVHRGHFGLLGPGDRKSVV